MKHLTLLTLLVFTAPFGWGNENSRVNSFPLQGKPLSGDALKQILAIREDAADVCLTCSKEACYLDHEKIDTEKLLKSCKTIFLKPKKFPRRQFMISSGTANADVYYSIDDRGKGSVENIEFNGDKLDIDERSEIRRNIKRVVRNTRWEPLVISGEKKSIGNLAFNLWLGGAIEFRAGDVFDFPPTPDKTDADEQKK